MLPAIGDLRARRIFDYAPVPFATQCFDAVRQAALELGHSHVDIVSGAGPDPWPEFRGQPALQNNCTTRLRSQRFPAS